MDGVVFVIILAIVVFAVVVCFVEALRPDKPTTPYIDAVQHEELRLFVNDSRRAFSAGGTAYAMYIEQEYRKVRLPEDRDGYTNHTFAAIMNWFAIPIASSPRKYSKYNISYNLYALLDFNIAMYVIFDDYMFGNGDPLGLRDSWQELYYKFLSQYCHKNFHLKFEDIAKLFGSRLEYYHSNGYTIDDIDVPLVEFIIRDIHGKPFAASSPAVDFEEKAKLFDTVTASLKNANEITKAILDRATQF